MEDSSVQYVWSQHSSVPACGELHLQNKLTVPSNHDERRDPGNAIDDASINHDNTNGEHDTQRDPMLGTLVELLFSGSQQEKWPPDARIADDDFGSLVGGMYHSDWTDGSDELTAAEDENSGAMEDLHESNACAETFLAGNILESENYTRPSTILTKDIPLRDEGTPISYDEHITLYMGLLSNSIPDDAQALTNGRTDLTSKINGSSTAPYFNVHSIMASWIDSAVQRCKSNEARQAILNSYDRILAVNSANIYGEQGRGFLSRDGKNVGFVGIEKEMKKKEG
ncbi:hypothetical protein BZA77DRAFT_289886 [Pyronema omphalodes]|nr:hypothetical protein BZA77DRAFT_289886 [Pyronema omphalodes]